MSATIACLLGEPAAHPSCVPSGCTACDFFWHYHGLLCFVELQAVPLVIGRRPVIPRAFFCAAAKNAMEGKIVLLVLWGAAVLLTQEGVAVGAVT